LILRLWTPPAPLARAMLSTLLFAAVSSFALAADRNAAFRWQLPVGFAQPFVPADNPMNAAKVALGKQLFSDTRLSITGRHSCASCHEAARAFTDGRTRAVGATGSTLTRNAPSLFNSAYNPSLGWDNTGATSLEKQLLRPLFNAHPIELGLHGRERQLEQTLGRDPDVAAAFALAFPAEPKPVTIDNIARAIAAFERTLIAGDSRFDRYVFRGDHAALTPDEKRGMELFFSPRTGCSACHSGLMFNGPWIDANNPRTRASFARNALGATAKRVPTLRNVTRTAPYMHDGRFADLREVVAHYERVAMEPSADAPLRREPLSAADQTALLAFLAALESP
jgi:cytochrome c peroxidase